MFVRYILQKKGSNFGKKGDFRKKSKKNCLINFKGDSGGALVNEDNVIFGVVSGGTSCITLFTSTLNNLSGKRIIFFILIICF